LEYGSQEAGVDSDRLNSVKPHPSEDLEAPEQASSPVQIVRRRNMRIVFCTVSLTGLPFTCGERRCLCFAQPVTANWLVQRFEKVAQSHGTRSSESYAQSMTHNAMGQDRVVEDMVYRIEF